MSPPERQPSTVREKLEAVRRTRNGERQASVATDIGVAMSTLRSWRKNEEWIRYQSSSSDTDGSREAYPHHKKPKLNDSSVQPLNLSWRNNKGCSSNSEESYDVDKPEQGPIEIPSNLHARMDARPKPFSRTDLRKAAGLNLLTTQVNFMAAADQEKNGYLPLEEQDRMEATRHWLEHQPAQQVKSSSQVPPSNDSSAPMWSFQGVDENTSRFWNWCRETCEAYLHAPMLAQPAYEPIRVQQLTNNTPQKNGSDQQNAENLMGGEGKTATIEGMTPNSKTATGTTKCDLNRDKDLRKVEKALEHGHQFLKWLEAWGHPEVTPVHISHFKTLLNSMKCIKCKLEHEIKLRK